MKRVVIYTYLLIFLISCNDDTSPKEGENTILHVGAFSLSQDEYLYLKEKQKRNNLDSNQLQAQIRDEAYILAFAKDNRFDTIPELNKRLDYALKFYVSQVDGYLWNKNIKPKLEITDSLLNTAYRKRDHIYHLDLLRLPKTSASKEDKYNKSGFDDLKKKINKDQFYQISLSYPFFPYGSFTDQLDNAKSGDIIGPFDTDQGSYMIYIRDVEITSRPPFEEIKNTLHQQLTLTLTNKYIWESQQHIKIQTRPNFHVSAIADLCKQYKDTEREWPNTMDDSLLMEYTLNGHRVQFYGKDFREFIRYQPMFVGSLKHTDDVMNMLETYLINQFLYEEVQKLEPENDKEYTLFVGWLRNRFYLNYFREKYIHPAIQVSDQEVVSYYHTQKDSLKSFEQVKDILKQRLYTDKEKEEYIRQLDLLKSMYRVKVDKII
ncbi:peptidyl-prolyl cis-trans isomerase [Sphingobacterium alkalisoli]|uniref:Peptidyl-prolyl cis-trans isomerase n=1 Tax=Sphingobacterium alkalisoli TaxID=1874115 RepID=A0A4U0H4F9_9SPHI|nr:peptidylprolyl isomerase [Sphingobacterium alkalisoli]TJY66583.1 peptidyl-prolyl cis-trans isomerase [Sphingobacterium alkalisoli]GGH15514.1 hypothetical protein GCM10011418_17260 [Sphingobacterium alkalisoli]